MSQDNAIVVATPKQSTVIILKQSDAILQIKGFMKQGVHFGPPYAGSKKETLLKPGAEWLARRFGLRSHYEELSKEIKLDMDEPWRSFILIEYRCTMIDIETGAIVGEAIGSCNSREDKYAWRWVRESDVPPGLNPDNLRRRDGTISEFKFAVEKKQTSGPYGKPPEYWQQFEYEIARGTARSIMRQKRDGSSEPAWEVGATEFRIPNDNPFDLLNTLSKMAQKRAKVSAVLEATGASSYFAPGDAEVSDAYYSDDDSGVVEGELVEITEQPPMSLVKSGSEPSDTPKSSGDGHTSQPPIAVSANWADKNHGDSQQRKKAMLWLSDHGYKTADEIKNAFHRIDPSANTLADFKADTADELIEMFESNLGSTKSKKSAAFDPLLIDGEIITNFDGKAPEDVLKALGKKAWTDYKTQAVAMDAVCNLARKEGWPVRTDKALYEGDKNRFAFHTILGPIYFYGHDSIKPLVGDVYFDTNQFATWPDTDFGGEYTPIQELIVTWKLMEAGYMLAEGFRPVDDIPF